MSRKRDRAAEAKMADEQRRLTEKLITLGLDPQDLPRDGRGSNKTEEARRRLRGLPRAPA